MAQGEILTGECHSTCVDENRPTQRHEVRVRGIFVEEGLIGGVARMGEMMQGGMGQKSAGDRGACLTLRPCDV